VLAIAALLAGLFLGAWWMDPLTGVLGAVLVTCWSWGLLRDTSRILLDHQAPEAVLRSVRDAVEGADDNRLYDLHVWSVAPGTYAAALGVVTHARRPAGHYRALIPAGLNIAHSTIEVQECHEVPPEDCGMSGNGNTTASTGPSPTQSGHMAGPRHGVTSTPRTRRWRRLSSQSRPLFRSPPSVLRQWVP
jgi:hypothetical protein